MRLAIIIIVCILIVAMAIYCARKWVKYWDDMDNNEREY